MKTGTMVAWGGIKSPMSEAANNASLNLKFSLAKAKPANELMTREINTVKKVTDTEL
jgi:hypothetical protein